MATLHFTPLHSVPMPKEARQERERGKGHWSEGEGNGGGKYYFIYFNLILKVDEVPFDLFISKFERIKRSKFFLIENRILMHRIRENFITECFDHRIVC